MRKIEKDLTKIPESLSTDTNNSTHIKRKELLLYGKYLHSDTYDKYYKKEDIKTQLKTIYHNKCAYCENYAEQLAVEHYRPKNRYFWLAYSWDNLMLGCPNCNRSKSETFKIKGEIATPINESELDYINTISSTEYDKSEEPLLLNPERDNLDNRFSFEKNGQLVPNGERAKYTMETCNLNRKDLMDERRKILDDFKKEVTYILTSATTGEQKSNLTLLVTLFKHNAYDEEKTFTSFRQYAISYLKELVKDALHSITPQVDSEHCK
jgi:uncharacterized protein (TIGR02646 family)